jgi:hypothetical protein
MLSIVKASTVPEAGAGSVGSMLLAEDLLLLVTDDASGRLSVPAAQVDAGLGGANLAELTLMNKVGLRSARPAQAGPDHRR